MNGTADQRRGIYEQVVEFIDAGRSFALATILMAEGSTPRKAGVRAIIDEKGRIWGTLGGGAVEAEAQRRAVEVCKSKQTIVLELALEGACRSDDAPICGGKMRILVDATVEKGRGSYAQAAQAVRQRRCGVLLTTVCTGAETEVAVRWIPQEAIGAEASFPGGEAIRACFEREEACHFVQAPRAPGGVGQEPNIRKESLVEPVIPMPMLLIVGGGHIGQALAQQAILVGFDVVVLDDRPEFTDPALFPEGVATRCGDIHKEVEASAIGRDTYIVIVTRGHKHDAEALEACIHAPAAYIGMIGSKRKVALMRKDFIESGLAGEEEFGRVFAPVGLDVGAVTVPEIAASIVAQLIEVRRKGGTKAGRYEKEP
jgi:xanthine dehydrogenase accessory factor